MEKTLQQYDAIVETCQELFLAKHSDYGNSWAVLRTRSLIDQIYIKAIRIRTIEESKENKVGESVDGEYIGIINYSIMGLMALNQEKIKDMLANYQEIKTNVIRGWYEKEMNGTRDLMIKKNHDYGEAWREMEISSITDLIIQKLMRMKSIEGNNEELKVSEDIDANYMDMINYAIFALIRLSEKA